MSGSTVGPHAEAAGPLPLDIETVRASARPLLAEGAALPAPDELAALTVALRGHIEALIPEVTAAAAAEPKDSIPRYCALACIGEARGKLHLGDDDSLAIRVSVARKLARSVNALCDHHENLNGVRPGAGR